MPSVGVQFFRLIAAIHLILWSSLAGMWKKGFLVPEKYLLVHPNAQHDNGMTCRQQKPCQKYTEILNYSLNKHKIILITAKICLKYTEPDRITTTLH